MNDVIGKFTPEQASLVVSGLIGFVTPWVVALVNNRGMTDHVRIAIAAFIALCGAVLQTVLMGNFSFANAATAFFVVYPISQIIYKNVAVKLGVRRLEDATSPRNTTADRDDDPALPTTSTVEAVEAAIKVAEKAPEIAVAAASRHYNVDDVERIARNAEEVDSGQFNK